MPLSVTPLSGSAFSVSLNPTDTVATLRAAVAQQTNQPVEHVRLRRSTDGTLFETGTLADYGYSNPATTFSVNMAPPPRPGDPAATDPTTWMRVAAPASTGDNSIYVAASTVDANNSVYFTGAFTGTIDFDPGNGSVLRSHPANNGSTSIFLAKYLADGTLAWVQTMGGATTHPSYGRQGVSVAVDQQGGVVLGATSVGEISLNNSRIGGELKSNNSGTVIKFNSKGDFVWSKIFGNANKDSQDLQAIALDASGDIIAAGTFYGSSLRIQNRAGQAEQTLGGDGRQPVFIAKIANNGTILWSTKAGGGDGGDPRVQGLSVDSNGAISVGGYYFNIRSGSINLTAKPQPTDYRNSFLWQLNSSNGSTTKLVSLGGDGNTKPELLYENIGGLVSRGNVTFMAGNVAGPNADLDPDSDVLASPSDQQSRLYLIRQSGAASTARLIDLNQIATAANGIDLSASPNLFVRELVADATGSRLYALVDARKNGWETSQSLLVQLDGADLTLLAAKQIDSSLARSARLAIDADGKLLVTGSLDVPLDLDPGTGDIITQPGPAYTVTEDYGGGYIETYSYTSSSLFLARWEPDASALASYGPTLKITSERSELASGDSSLITFELSKPANDFTASDVSVSDGQLSGFQKIANTNDQRYTALFTPAVNTKTRAMISVAADSFSQASDPSKRNQSTTSLALPIDTTPPVVQSLKLINQAQDLVLHFSQILGDGQGSNPGLPVSSAFSIDADGSAVSVSSVNVNGDLLTLRLSAAIADSVKQLTVRYSDPSANNDAAALQDRLGQDAASFTSVLTNVAPTLSASSSQARSWLEGSQPLVVFPGSLQLLDSDSNAFNQATVRISSGFTAGDQLTVNTTNLPIQANFDASAGQLTLVGEARESLDKRV